jgi:dTDP-4-dehydrorhamnose reductase
MSVLKTTITRSQSMPELWGGLECTVNRIDDTFRDQLDYQGHYLRKDDLEKFADLGIKALRYPVLWELHELKQGEPIDWTWINDQLQRIRELNIKPIAGLVHHGSGPKFTDLNNKDFPMQLAQYALQVARKFPWIKYYTPVNEPLTTARFSGLYGFWYPHHKTPLSFLTQLLNQLKGVVLSMKAIRTINPEAKLVQTEDLTKIHSTPLLRYQADFENARRWLTFDILCGKLDTTHFMWDHFIEMGIEQQTLEFFLENKFPPDIIGLNYYVTSERYLDHQLENYPSSCHGTNGIHRYADVEAVRSGKQAGLKTLLKEAWSRFELPMALTEVHLNCTREEQMRWIKESWNICVDVVNEGIPIKAVTAWALLGAYDWNSLLTKKNNHYESGVFDIKDNIVRKTANARLIRSLAFEESFHHPVLEQEGWWHKSPGVDFANDETQTSPILIIGKHGTIATAFAKICRERSIRYICVSGKEVNLINEDDIEKLISKYKPWALINATGYINIDIAEVDKDNCYELNATIPALLANVCKRKGVRFITFSTDFVFDGLKQSPYLENDTIKPLNVYGETKAAGEALVLECNPQALIIRTSACFSPWNDQNFPTRILSSLKNREACCVTDELTVSPTYVPDLVHLSLDLLIDEEENVWHISNEGNLTWKDFAFAVAEHGGFNKMKITTKKVHEMGWTAKRPTYSALKSSKGVKLPTLENALHRFFKERI